MAKMYGKGKSAIESEEQQKLRWQVELEFVQCLANPNYLNFLAQRGYFKDQSFINYLKYLQYWKEPDYAKYLMYPMCLYFLDLLQYEHFRREIVNSQCCKFIDDQVILQWQHYTRKRIRMFNSVNGIGGHLPPGEAPNDSQAAAGGGGGAQLALQNGIGGGGGVGGGQTQTSQSLLPPQVTPAQQQQQLNGISSAGNASLLQKMQ